MTTSHRRISGIMMLSIFCCLIVACQQSTTKQLLGNWHIKAAVQYGDTLFDLEGLDTLQLMKQQMDQIKMTGQKSEFSKTDSMMIRSNIRYLLKTTGRMTMEFEKDSIYHSRLGDQVRDSRGRYWLNETADTLYLIEDSWMEKKVFWLFHLDRKKKIFTIEIPHERMLFVLKKE